MREIPSKPALERLNTGPASFPRIVIHLTARHILDLFLLGEVGKALGMAVSCITPARASAVEERWDLLVGAIFETDPARRSLRNDQVIGGVELLGGHDGFELCRHFWKAISTVAPCHCFNWRSSFKVGGNKKMLD